MNVIDVYSKMNVNDVYSKINVSLLGPSMWGSQLWTDGHWRTHDHWDLWSVSTHGGGQDVETKRRWQSKVNLVIGIWL